MKVAYSHLVSFIPSKPDVDDISQKLFQLGHEHEIHDGIFNLELTPNRGDCLSINGLLRDLAVFYKVSFDREIYKNNIKPLKINFINNQPEACPCISFLKIDIEEDIKPYHGSFQDYFKNLDINKTNFFTDISNYISYETGQPTHCYDSAKITNTLSLEVIKEEYEFDTLMSQKIKLKNTNLVFMQNDTVINLAGIMGGDATACSSNTRSVIIECAYFNPENIIGQSVKYNIKSDAAHKFERGVDPMCHEYVLRRLLKIVSEHTIIKNIEIFKKDYEDYNSAKIPFNLEHINTILGISLEKKKFEDCLLKLGFSFSENMIVTPSYRSDIKTINDIAEEIARVIGYDNIPSQTFKIPYLMNNEKDSKLLELGLKNLLINHGFFEVINNPFVNYETSNSIKVDNPLDSSRKNIRTNLEKSLIENLLYNERRQQDSIKLFEISDIYSFEKEVIKNKKMLGIICTGRVGKNYLDFSKKIDAKYLIDIFNKLSPKIAPNPISINRKKLDTKSNNKIIYLEIELDYFKDCNSVYLNKPKLELNKDNFIKYSPISSFPFSVRDLSFAVKNLSNYYELQEFILNYKEKLIKDIFIFDFFNNQENNEIKIGFRFIFQSKLSTITESEVSNIIDQIIYEALTIDSVTIPGLNK
jgi:phenylalanyl-tRNA synthetase beta chain